MTDEQRAFRCGCFPPFPPRNMGRGAARQRRLDAYFDRPCLTCALASDRAYVDVLNHWRGGRLWEVDKEQAEKILARRNLQTRRRYD